MGLSHDPLSQVTSLLTLGTEHNPRQEMFFCPQCKAGYFWPFAISPRTFSFYGYFALCFPTTCLLRNWLQLGPDTEQQTGLKLGKEYIKVIYCHPAYLNSMQSTLCKMLGWMKLKPELRFPGEIAITSDMQMTPP